MNIKLYEVADDYLRALQDLETADLPEQAIIDTLDGLKGEVATKARNVAAYVLNIEAEAGAIRAVEEKLSARRQTLERQAAWIRNYLLVQMERTGISRIKANDGTFTLALTPNPPRVEVFNEKLLPPDYIRTQIIEEPDKQAISKALKAGIEVPGARLMTKNRITIR